jgi:hypothetical protein
MTAMKHVKAEMAALTKTFQKGATARRRGRSAAAAPEAPRLVQFTVKLEPEYVRRVVGEVARRKGDRLPGRTIQAVMTEAIEQLLPAAVAEPGRRKAG